MVLIIGGAYQGKRAFAKETFRLEEGEIFTCSGAEIDFSARCVDALEAFTLACVRCGADPVAYFAEREALWRESILICRDVSSGVVPLETDMRRWREETGRLCQYLARHAQRVSRIFCGLEQRLK